MLRSLLATLAELLGLAGLAARMRERAEAERTGAIKQQNADNSAELEKQRDQLEKAVNRRPGDSGRRLDDGTF